MSENENIYTEIIDFEDSNLISVKLAAINNKVRFSILEILRDFQKLNMNKDNSFKKDPYYSREINDILLKKYDIRAVVDERNEKIGRKIRDNEMKRIPYMLIVGEKEAENGEVAVRKQGEGDQGTMKIEEFAKKMSEEVQNMINKW